MRFVHQFFGADAERKSETLLKADGAQNASRVIHERERMQNAHQTALEVDETAQMVVEFTIMGFIETQGESVDGEISAMQIEFD